MAYISVTEILQLVLALIGTGVIFWRLWIAIENSLSIITNTDTDLRILIAESQIISELFKLFMQGCLVAMGIISVLLPPPSPDETPEILQSILVRFGLITISLTIIIDSLIQEYRRKLFFKKLHGLNEPNSGS